MPNQPFLTIQKIASNCSEQENHWTEDLVHQLDLLSPSSSPKPQLPQQLCPGGRAAGPCPTCAAHVQGLPKPTAPQLKPQSSHPVSTMGRINRSRKTARERHLHSRSENCAIKILSPMTHTEPISVIVWQGNNITEPINTSWGAALLTEQRDGPLPTPPQPPAPQHREGEGQENTAGLSQPRGTAGAWERTVVSGNRAGAGQDTGGDGAEPRKHGGKKMVESTSTPRMFPKQTVRVPAAAAEGSALTQSRLTHNRLISVLPMGTPGAEGVSQQSKHQRRLLRAQGDALEHPRDARCGHFPAHPAEGSCSLRSPGHQLGHPRTQREESVTTSSTCSSTKALRHCG